MRTFTLLAPQPPELVSFSLCKGKKSFANFRRPSPRWFSTTRFSFRTLLKDPFPPLQIRGGHSARDSTFFLSPEVGLELLFAPPLNSLFLSGSVLFLESPVSPASIPGFLTGLPVRHASFFSPPLSRAFLCFVFSLFGEKGYSILLEGALLFFPRGGDLSGLFPRRPLPSPPEK